MKAKSCFSSSSSVWFDKHRLTPGASPEQTPEVQPSGRARCPSRPVGASTLTEPNPRGLKHSQGGWAGGRRPTRPQRPPQPPGHRGETSAGKRGAGLDPTAQPAAARGDRLGVSARPRRATPSTGRRGGRRRRRGQRRDLPWARELLKVPPPPPGAQRRRGAVAAWPGSAAACAAAAGGSSSCGRPRGAEQPLSVFDVQFLNAVGDLLDLIPALFEYSTRSGQCNVDAGGHGKYQWDMGHCSALIKVLPGYENIYFAHSSWFTYAATLRIYKHWNFNIVDPYTRTGRVSFSSYPGFLVSLDDFYILGSGLIMLQTTNSVFNQTLIKQVVPESLFAWQRVRIANMMADGGKAWAETFSRCNSGTYNNQYMVLDLKKVKLQKSLDEGALYIVEQIPTLVEYSDQTNVLRKGYWPSYNIPFHEKIYNLSGYAEYVEKYGLDFSYELAPRAKIFRRDQGKVTNLEDMKYIMRYNNYQRDPYAEHNPCNTICCREDLNPSFPVPAGCYDSKVSDFRLASAFTATAINGPPVQGGLPVFTWRRFNHTRHQGLPESYNFKFVTMRPIL
uniref:Phospholipase B-like n=1 Tax=Anas zonorhyncha TaxID=75864 RepID=A0A8B9U2V8_9AVES